jgi:hypothetical protein
MKPEFESAIGIITRARERYLSIPHDAEERKRFSYILGNTIIFISGCAYEEGNENLLQYLYDWIKDLANLQQPKG